MCKKPWIFVPTVFLFYRIALKGVRYVTGKAAGAEKLKKNNRKSRKKFIVKILKRVLTNHYSNDIITLLVYSWFYFYIIN